MSLLSYLVILFFLCTGFVRTDSDPGRRVVVVRKIPSSLDGASSYSSRHVLRNRIYKAPDVQKEKYKYRRKYYNLKEYLRSIEKRKSRLLYRPPIQPPHRTISTTTPTPYRESLNLNQPDSPYGLIHKLFPLENNEIQETKKDSIPQDLDPDEVWLSDGNLLVLKVGTLRVAGEEYRDRKLGLEEPEEDIESRPSRRVHYIDRRMKILATPRKRRRFALERRKERL